MFSSRWLGYILSDEFNLVGFNCKLIDFIFDMLINNLNENKQTKNN